MTNHDPAPDMVERVARAIYHGKARNRPWEKLPVEFQRQYHKQALAAIEAMREPTEAMLEAIGLNYMAYEAYDLWQAMIDEALQKRERG